MIRSAAEGQKRTISKYIEFATINYAVNEAIVDDAEMDEILHFGKDKKGLADVKAGWHKVIG